MKEPLNILLVDDQPAKLLSYEAILQDLGENLITANSGREALDQLLRTEIPIVLMDVSMPELDGFELAEIIRQHPRFTRTAIIFVSAVHLSDVDRVKAYASGAVDYVSVPIIPEILRAKVSVFAELYRKRRDAEHLNQALESRVAERTAELEAALRQQSALADMLKEADRRKDEFLALLAHELRNPLAPLVNAIEIMGRKNIVDPQLNWCRDVFGRQVRQLSRLVDDLLEVSRITLGKIRLRSEPLDVRQAIAAAIEICRPMIEQHRHTLSVVIPDLPLMVNGDAARLTQAIANLVNNAVKYQDDGGSIAIHAIWEADEIEIAVLDSGIGIPEGLRSEIFGLFVQGNRRPDAPTEGLGVGLSLVKTVVDLHGGSVCVEGRGDEPGSRFVIRLPVCRLGDSEGERVLAPERSCTRQPWNVLILDDNVDAAEGLATLLRFEGHEVNVAHDGPSALELLTRVQPQLLLVDIGLPGMDGYEFCRRVRAAGKPPNAVIIAVTGYGQEQDRERARNAGFDAHAVKPVSVNVLIELAERSHAAAGNSARTQGSSPPYAASDPVTTQNA